jgi:hypothetical protein
MVPIEPDPGLMEEFALGEEARQVRCGVCGRSYLAGIGPNHADRPRVWLYQVWIYDEPDCPGSVIWGKKNPFPRTATAGECHRL